jgi:hypothetical protein
MFIGSKEQGKSKEESRETKDLASEGEGTASKGVGTSVGTGAWEGRRVLVVRRQ